jgi:8-amino-7-oxononanoate synthase
VSITSRLSEIESLGLWRQVQTPSGLDFSSNDYLGFAKSPVLETRFRERLSGALLGGAASRLLRGHLREHDVLETRLAQFKGTESTLFFANGYMANLACITALVQPHDRVLSDAQNHASIIDAIRLSGCSKIIFPHLDVSALQQALATSHSGQTFIITESLFGMDGDIANLSRYADLAEQYDASLIVDDSHGVGVYGAERASGLTEGLQQRCTAIVSTCGKALGVFGAFVACSQEVKQLLINVARTFIFTTATPPYMLHAVHAALDHLADNTLLGQRACALAKRLVPDATSPIVPIVIGDNQLAMQAALRLQQQGFDIRAIRPPTVPLHTARLRISVHADHTEKQIDCLRDCLGDLHDDA